MYIILKLQYFTSSIVSVKFCSVSSGNQTIMSVVIDISLFRFLILSINVLNCSDV